LPTYLVPYASLRKHGIDYAYVRKIGVKDVVMVVDKIIKGNKNNPI